MLSTMSIVMSTAELKSLLEKRRREKVDQDEREKLLIGIRELDAYASVSSSSASSESGNMDPIVVNLLEERDEVIVPVQKNSTKLITGFMSKLSPGAAKEERSRMAAETVS